ncbi:MAG: hypothetical protein M0R80_01335 [Proteobacteria bacterium]|jgi:hypothetical protein|nr:hypothetical protein [Pseudomonadota bacterium]
MKATTPQRVHKLGVKEAVKAINKELRQQKCLIKISGSENRAISNLQDAKLLTRVVRKFEKAGWFVDVRETKGMTTYLRFRTEPTQPTQERKCDFGEVVASGPDDFR